VFIFWLRTNNLSITDELSPLPEPYNPLADPVMKETLNVMSVANSIVDEVVDRLLNEAAEKILKEDYNFIVMIRCNIWCMEQLIRHVNCCNIFLCDA
jgi:hypothetical protein